MATAPPDPAHIMQVGMGFWASKTVLSAVELELFTVLGEGPMTGEEIGNRLGLHPRAIEDFLDALVALRFLDREGTGGEGRYRNTAETAAFLDKRSQIYFGGILEMANARLFGFWGDHRGAAIRLSTERDQAQRQADVRGALQRARPARAVHAGDAGRLA